jgi:hypothetical protein
MFVSPNSWIEPEVSRNIRQLTAVMRPHNIQHFSLAWNIRIGRTDAIDDVAAQVYTCQGSGQGFE